MPQLQWPADSSGLWVPASLASAIAIPPSGLVTAENIDYVLAGPRVVFRGRRGYTPFSVSGLPAGEIRSIYRFYPRAASPSTFVTAHNGTSVNFYHDTNDDGVFTTVTGNFVSNSIWYHTTLPDQDKMFMTNGGHGLRSYDGTTLALVTITGVQVDGPYITEWRGRLFATKASEINYSVYASDVGNPASWSGLNQINASDPQGGRIVGLVGFGDILGILKDTCLIRFTGDIATGLDASKVVVSKKGCVSPRSIQVTDRGVLYVGRDSVYLADFLNEPVDVGYPLRGLFTTVAVQNLYVNAIGVWFPRRQQYWLQLTPSDIYVLHFLEGHAPIWSKIPGWGAMLSGTAWSGGGDDGRLLLGNATGTIYQMDTGTTDNGGAITSRLCTSYLTADGTPEGYVNASGRVSHAIASFKSASNLAGVIRYDNNTGNTVSYTHVSDGSLDVQDDRVFIPSFANHGKRVALDITSTASHNFELYGLAAETRLRSLRRYTHK